MRRACFYSRPGGDGYCFVFSGRSIVVTRSYPRYINTTVYPLDQVLCFLANTVCAFDRMRSLTLW